MVDAYAVVQEFASGVLGRKDPNRNPSRVKGKFDNKKVGNYCFQLVMELSATPIGLGHWEVYCSK